MRNIATIFLLSIVIISNQLHASENYSEKELEELIQKNLKTNQKPHYSWKEAAKSIVRKLLIIIIDNKHIIATVRITFPFFFKLIGTI